MITEQIEQDLKNSLKEKNEAAVSALRNLKAALKNVQIELGHELSDDQALAVVAKKVKQHKDSIESFIVGNRTDLVDTEKAQMSVLQKYLPKEMSQDELASIVSQVIAETSATVKDFGKVMKDVMAKVKGRADGSVISKIVKEQLK